MTIALFFTLLAGLFKFPGELSALIRLLEKTPEEKHQELMTKIQAEGDKLASTGRPTW